MCMKVDEIDYSYLLNMQIYSKKQINNAGYIINDKTKEQKERDEALNIIEDFRLQHLYPTTAIRYFIANKSKKYGLKILIMQRLKKMPTILDKISNNRKQYIKDLYEMQDIGGVRIVFNKVNDVLKFFNELKEMESETNFKIRKVKNYIENPKSTGYRGIHIVYNVKKSDKQKNIDKMKVELQIRSNLQHIWATTLEIYDYWYGTSLKTQRGSEDWAEFFELVSSMFAGLEGKPILEKHKNINYVVNRLKKIKDKKIQKLKAIRVGTAKSTTNNQNYKNSDILIIKKEKKTDPEIIKFSKQQSQEAYKQYQELENRYKNNKKVEIVMFSVNNGKKIIKAYPNFFNDTKNFIEIIEAQYKKYDKNISFFKRLKQRIYRFFKTHSLISNIHNSIL